MDKYVKDELMYLTFMRVKLSCLDVWSNRLPDSVSDLVKQMLKATLDRKQKIFNRFTVKIYPNGDESIF